VNRLIPVFIATLLCTAPPLFFANGRATASHREWIVAPDGQYTNTGTMDSPFSLARALSGKSINPGDTIWLRGGNYYGHFISELQGAPQLPVRIGSYPGEWATLVDNRPNAPNSPVLWIKGGWAIYRDFEITNINTQRRTSSLPDGFNRPHGIQAEAPHTKIVNLVIHDVGVAIGFWNPAIDSELYGNIIYNNGWVAPDRGHGHGIYTQNEQGTKVIRDNVIFKQFGWGLHIYPRPGGITGYDVEGNVSFNNGVPENGSSNSGNLLVDGYPPFHAARILVAGNYTYQSFASRAGTSLGWLNPTPHEDVMVRDNYFVGGNPVLAARGWKKITVSNNTLIGDNGLVQIAEMKEPVSSASWNHNNYFDTKPVSNDPAFVRDGQRLNFVEWRRSTADEASTYKAVRPARPQVFVVPNRYESGRAHVVVYNWTHAKQVSVDVSSVLTSGMPYELRNVQNYFGQPVLRGTYTGLLLDIPMTRPANVPPVGWSDDPRSTGDDFAVFVLASKFRTFGDRQQRLSSSVGENLKEWVGSYCRENSNECLRVDAIGNQLLATATAEPGQPLYRMLPAGPNRYRFEGLDASYYLVFTTNPRKPPSMILSRGSAGTVVLSKRP
jgi:hypothetical protein